jgi:hypothetical protein
MIQPHLTSEAVVRRGKELYEEHIRANVEADGGDVTIEPLAGYAPLSG